MFDQLRHLDSAFRHIRGFSLGFLLFCAGLSGYSLYQSYRWVAQAEARIYVLAGGQVLRADASTTRENRPVEARHHVQMFHEGFFSLDPDEQVIQANLSRALYLADASAKHQYDNLKERGYYSDLIAGNVSQTIMTDSITIDTEASPLRFHFYGRQKLVRATTLVTRQLVTTGTLRTVARSDHNPHGLLIEGWRTLANRDLTVERRYTP